jgi:epoxyqueuosine reductase
MNQELTQALKAKAKALGFSMVGVVPAQPARRLDAYLRWIEAEMHGKMGYMARPDRVIRRRDLDVILPGVESLVCVGLDYFTRPLPPQIAADPGRGRISNYAWGVDYHDVMTPRLEELAAWLGTAVGDSHDVAGKVYVDTGAILERDHAESAGFGFTGKNTMLIAPQRGSWFFLGELLTTVPLAYDAPPAQTPSCGSCRRCLDACPTNAFPEPYVLDARRCISYLTIELKGWIPRALRPLMGNWVYGCDVCQDVCPFNRFASPAAEVGFYPDDEETVGSGQWGADRRWWDAAAPPLPALLALDEAGFRERFADSPILRIKRKRLVRNACVAAGNWGSETAVSSLTALLHDPEPLVRGHAAWALRQIDTPSAQAARRAALTEEKDPRVRAEIEGAASPDGAPER